MAWFGHDRVMDTVFMHAVVSVDGFIADAEDNVGPLFEWYFNGDAEIVAGGPFKVSTDSAGYVRPMWQRIGTTVMGRHLFDLTNGWEGIPPAGEHILAFGGTRQRGCALIAVAAARTARWRCRKGRQAVSACRRSR